MDPALGDVLWLRGSEWDVDCVIRYTWLNDLLRGLMRPALASRTPIVCLAQ
jgi:hypothetical protein